MLLRLLCIGILGYAMYNLTMDSDMFLELETKPTAEHDDWRAEVVGYQWCYIFQHTSDGVGAALDAADRAQDAQNTAVAKLVDGGEGPCGGAFETQEEFDTYVTERQVRCEAAKDTLSSSDDDECEVNTFMLRAITAAGGTYALLIITKMVLFVFQVNRKGWADQAQYLATQGLTRACEFWLVSYAPGVVLAPVTGAVSHSHLSVVEATVNQSHWVLTIVLAMVFGCYFLIMTLLGGMIECCRDCCCKGHRGAAEHHKRDAAACRTCGWITTLSLPVIGIMVQLAYETLIFDFPTFNLAAVLTFTEPDFTMGMSIDVAQALQFLAFCVDILVVAINAANLVRRTCLWCKNKILGESTKTGNNKNAEDTSRSTPQSSQSRQELINTSQPLVSEKDAEVAASTANLGAVGQETKNIILGEAAEEIASPLTHQDVESPAPNSPVLEATDAEAAAGAADAGAQGHEVKNIVMGETDEVQSAVPEQASQVSEADAEAAAAGAGAADLEAQEPEEVQSPVPQHDSAAPEEAGAGAADVEAQETEEAQSPVPQQADPAPEQAGEAADLEAKENEEVQSPVPQQADAAAPEAQEHGEVQSPVPQQEVAQVPAAEADVAAEGAAGESPVPEQAEVAPGGGNVGAEGEAQPQSSAPVQVRDGDFDIETEMEI